MTNKKLSSVMAIIFLFTFISSKVWAVKISSQIPRDTSQTSILVSVHFTDPVENFAVPGSLIVQGAATATPAGPQGAGQNFNFYINPQAGGTISVRVAPGVVMRANHKTTPGSNTLTWNYSLPAKALPGQAGNLVGYANAPGYPGHLTQATQCLPTGSGTQSDPYVYSFCDFNAGTGGTLIQGPVYAKYYGCLFESNSLQNYNVQVSGLGGQVTFEYSSITPLSSLAAAPPNAAWPSSGAGLQLVGNQPQPDYEIANNAGYEFGINVIGNVAVTIDHCDLWGGSNLVVYYSTTAPMVLSNSWLHDEKNPFVGDQISDHTDGVGYLNGDLQNGPSNVLISGNTIASIANGNGIAFQGSPNVENNLVITGNFFSGFADFFAFNFDKTPTNCMTASNIFATDLPWEYAPLYANYTSLFSQNGNTWSGNTLSVLPGTSPYPGSYPLQWTPAENNYFLWPDGATLSLTDF